MSLSSASTVKTLTWFSCTLNVAEDVNDGAALVCAWAVVGRPRAPARASSAAAASARAERRRLRPPPPDAA